KLVERFDGGTPDRKLDRYWVYLAGGFPVMIPAWGVEVYAAIALGVALAALLRLKRRETPGPARIRWSTLKTALFSLIIASCGWFSSDLVGLIRGLRHPWYTSIDLFILQGAIAAIAAGWSLILLSRKLPLSRSPYLLFLRAAIPLAIAVMAGACVSFKRC